MATSTPLRPTGSSGRGRLPAPTRDRRPALAALALLLVVTGALASGLLAYRSGDRVDVLVASRDIPVGAVPTASDFRVARVAADGASSVEAAARLRFQDRTRAVVTVKEGTLINASMFTVAPTTPEDGAIAGAVLTAAQRPVDELQEGQIVRVYSVPPANAGGTPTVLLVAARVVQAGQADTGGSQPVSLLVPTATADAFVAAASAGTITVVRLADGVRPVVDLATAE